MGLLLISLNEGDELEEVSESSARFCLGLGEAYWQYDGSIKRFLQPPQAGRISSHCYCNLVYRARWKREKEERTLIFLVLHCLHPTTLFLYGRLYVFLPRSFAGFWLGIILGSRRPRTRKSYMVGDGWYIRLWFCRYTFYLHKRLTRLRRDQLWCSLPKSLRWSHIY